MPKKQAKHTRKTIKNTQKKERAKGEKPTRKQARGSVFGNKRKK